MDLLRIQKGKQMLFSRKGYMNLSTVRDLMKLLGYKHVASVRKAIELGKIEGTKLGNMWVFTPEQVRKASEWKAKYGRTRKQTRGNVLGR